MKPKTKIIVVATTITITSLMITAYYTEPRISPSVPQICPMSEVVQADKACTPTAEPEPIVVEEIQQIRTQAEEIIEPTNHQEITVTEYEILPTQPTTEDTSDSTPIPDTQTTTKPSTSPPSEPATPKNGDTRIVDGKQKSYLLGFGWVDYMGENECIFEEGMYENGNKVGIMD